MSHRYLLWLCVFICCACASTREFPDASAKYNPGQSFFNPQYALYAENDSVARLFFSIDLHHLPQKNSDSAFVPVQLVIRHYNQQTKELTDTLLRRINIQRGYSSFSSYFAIPLGKQLPALMEIECSIPINQINDTRWFLVDSAFKQHARYCLIADSSYWFSPFVTRNKLYTLHSHGLTQKPFVTEIDTVFQPAEPPFGEDTIKPLLLRSQQLDTNQRFRPQKPLLVAVNADSSLLFTRFCGDSLFPQINSAIELLKPLIYIEKNVALQQSAKITLDAFWYKIANQNTNRARELVRVFYNRVVLANSYFTSYKEGWKTDRGMIFIMMGLPNEIQLTASGEQWIYTGSDKKEPLSFQFIHSCGYQNPNDYTLQRSQQYASVWKEVIVSWKKGKIFIY